MELKWCRWHGSKVAGWSSNRTFMELKYFLGEISEKEDIKF